MSATNPQVDNRIWVRLHSGRMYRNAGSLVATGAADGLGLVKLHPAEARILISDGMCRRATSSEIARAEAAGIGAGGIGQAMADDPGRPGERKIATTFEEAFQLPPMHGPVSVTLSNPVSLVTGVTLDGAVIDPSNFTVTGQVVSIANVDIDPAAPGVPDDLTDTSVVTSGRLMVSYQ